ncbi:YfcL protein [Klebsiella pneumoniae]|uniref:YfcL protein n=1 Tax=Klebsiella pneumoniae TaxID=573 RepID=A0A377XQZ9_KLEPN|nr:YfcL protein [Klebsiella pneumoniae]
MIAEFESRILALIDNMVDHASDDELFAGGYLRGHLTLRWLSWKVRASILLTRYTAELARAWRKPSALANCRRRTKFWCRGCGITCINRRKIRPEPCCSPGQASAVPGKLPALHGFISPLFPSAVFSPTADSDSAPPGCRYPAAAVPRSFAPPAAQRLTARCKARATRARQA